MATDDQSQRLTTFFDSLKRKVEPDTSTQLPRPPPFRRSPLPVPLRVNSSTSLDSSNATKSFKNSTATKLKPTRSQVLQKKTVLPIPHSSAQSSTTSQDKQSPDTQPSTKSVWDTYTSFLTLGPSKSTRLAYCKNDPNNRVVVIKQRSKACLGLIQPRQELIQYSHPNLIETLASYLEDNDLYVVQELMEVSLDEIIGLPQELEEDHIWVVCYEVSNPLGVRRS